MSANPIQLFVPTYEIEEVLSEIRECLEIGWTGLGFKTVKFEEAWSAYTGLPHSHFINSNTVGLHLAVRLLKDAYGWTDGDEIITTPLTFVSTNHAILYENLKPVFADIDESLCLDPLSIERCITPKTRAVMYVGLGGNAGRLHEVQALCRARGLRLILDAAHMAGTRVNGKHIGPEADVTVFSFQAVKNLPTADSGMICFQRADLDERCRKMSWLGIDKDTYARSNITHGNYKWYYDVTDVGFKANGNSIMAAMGLAQLRHLDRDNQFRDKLCHVYEKSLSGVNGVRLIPVADRCSSSRHLFPIRVAADRRDQLMAAMAEEKIFAGVHYRCNTRYRMYTSGFGACPRAETADQELLSLPLHLRMTEADARRVAESVKANLVSTSSATKAA